MATQLPLPHGPHHLGPPPAPGSHLSPPYTNGHHSSLSPQSPPGHASGSLPPRQHPHRDTLPPFGAAQAPPPPPPQSPYQAVYESHGQYAPPPAPPPPQDQYSMPRFMPQSAMAPPMMHGQPQAHKRAYRQRRKDPSCDACRERKVKCDATDTTSCSECSGRNVKCQFTKETNRRMSSIKQVQDLEKQLLAARQQVSQLQQQHMNGAEGKSAVDDDRTDDDEEAGPSKRRRLSRGQDFQQVARNIEKYGCELIRLPAALAEPSEWDVNVDVSPPELPPKAVCDELIQDFKTMLYTAFPMFSMAQLKQRHEEIHKHNQYGRPIYSQGWYALYFAVLAFGTLRHQKHDGRTFYQRATKLIDLWGSSQSMDAMRATLLLSMFQVESNNITSGFKTLGHCVRAALDMGLHRRTEQRSAADEQARLSLWWCIFSTERLFALELGRPSMIDDSDCPPFAQAVGYDNRPIERQTTLPGSDPQFDFINQVARCTTHLQKAFKQPVICAETLHDANDQINRCLAAFPPHQQPTADDYLDMTPSTPVVYVQNLRLMLYRHNLSPASPPEVRKEALAECVAAALDTARLMRRCMHQSPSLAGRPSAVLESSEDKLRLASSAFICSHLWRAMLILVCSGEFAAALDIAHASAAIGRHRRINVACGRYLEFLVKHVRNTRSSIYSRLPLHENEELLAYASGDLQSNLDQAWVWQSHFGSVGGAAPNPDFNAANADGLERWNGWKDIVAMLEKLVDDQRWEEEQRRNGEAVTSQSPPPHHLQQQPGHHNQHHYSHPRPVSANTMYGPKLSPSTPTYAVPEKKLMAPATPSGRSMSIKDLI